MKTRTEKILLGLRFITWIAMLGYSIECGCQIISVIVSFYNPVTAKQIPGINQDLFNILQHDRWYYMYAMVFVIGLSALKVHVWYYVIDLLAKFNLSNPFSIEVMKKLERISYDLFSIWGISVLAKLYIRWVSDKTGERLDIINVGGEFLFIAGIVYIVSQIFRRGIEIQEENQLTV